MWGRRAGQGAFGLSDGILEAGQGLGGPRRNELSQMRWSNTGTGRKLNMRKNQCPALWDRQ